MESFLIRDLCNEVSDYLMISEEEVRSNYKEVVDEFKHSVFHMCICEVKMEELGEEYVTKYGIECECGCIDCFLSLKF